MPLDIAWIGGKVILWDLSRNGGGLAKGGKSL